MGQLVFCARGYMKKIDQVIIDGLRSERARHTAQLADLKQQLADMIHKATLTHIQVPTGWEPFLDMVVVAALRQQVETLKQQLEYTAEAFTKASHHCINMDIQIGGLNGNRTYDETYKALLNLKQQLADMTPRVQRLPTETETVCGQCGGHGWSERGY